VIDARGRTISAVEEGQMAKQHEPDPNFDATTARRAHREALRRAAEELNTTSSLEAVLARISAEVTAAASRSAGAASGKVGQDAAKAAPKLPEATASSRRP
jgi:hypothetical protein